MVRSVDYRVTPDPSLKPFCELDSIPGTQGSDLVALTGLLGQTVAVGHPGDPDGDGVVTANDVLYCNGQAGGAQVDPNPGTEPDPSPGSDGGGSETSGGEPTPDPGSDPTPSSGADVRVSWTASTGAAEPRRGLSLTARVTNAGPEAATATAVWLDSGCAGSVSLAATMHAGVDAVALRHRQLACGPDRGARA
ncbi:MAG: hypothetical protein R2724_30005 [Bryobacterales bacterium]